jgi:hypothetical protein
MIMSAIVIVTALAFPIQSVQPAPQAPPPCESAEYRQFDFWVGEWSVTVSGKPAGRNRIESVHNGCVLVEHWSAAGGGTGISMNYYNRQTRQWHQTWVGSGGGVLLLSGGLRDGAMVMQSGPMAGAAGSTVINRITWSRLPSGDVRQHWEASADNGTTWTTSFDGLYKK